MLFIGDKETKRFRKMITPSEIIRDKDNELIVEDTMSEVTGEVTEQGASKGLTLGKGLLIVTGGILLYHAGKKVVRFVKGKIEARKKAKALANDSADNTSEVTE